MVKKNILFVIPARGGSKGIPRKNLRSLNGQPLLSYIIKAALKSTHNADIYVSSDDDEILSLALKLGVKIHKRHSDIARDETTLDPVIYNVYKHASTQGNKKYDVIVTLQPTSPNITTASIDNAIRKLVNNSEIDTIISVKDDTHLSWRKENGRFLPNYAKRVNRQYLTPMFKETGAFLITRATVITEHNRIGSHVDLYLLSGAESIDIDTYDDWSLCEYYLRKRKILFVVSGYTEIGLGHVYNTLLLANDILNHDIHFLVDADSQLALEKISDHNYPVVIQKHKNIVDDILLLEPYLVINDILDTSSEYIKSLKNKGIKVINIEDLGEGSVYADMVINAIYPEKNILPNHYFGQKYFCLRDEFLLSPSKKVTDHVEHVLLTFGGVDSNNYTLKVLKAIYDYCIRKKILIVVMTGFGYNQYETLGKFKGIAIVRNAANISDYMLKADVIFTSAGRTTFEAAAIGTPTIVMAQNVRETTHFFASEEFGFLNLGLGKSLSPDDILQSFRRLVESPETRKYMGKLMKQVDLTQGRVNVKNLIYRLLGEV